MGGKSPGENLLSFLRQKLRLYRILILIPPRNAMPGSESFHVKCELPSDEDESNSQFANSFSHQLSSDYVPVKLEPNSQIDDNASTNLLHHFQCVEGTLEELAPAPAGPAATPVCEQLPSTHDASFATLEPASYAAVVGSSLIDRHIKMMSANEVADSADFVPLMSIKDEPTSEGEQQHFSGDDNSDSNGALHESASRSSPKSWTQQDMEKALEALRKHNMSLTKASATYGIPSTTLWQRAHRLGIDTPKKEGASKSWSEADLRGALHALRAGAISANKASKAYEIAPALRACNAPRRSASLQDFEAPSFLGVSIPNRCALCQRVVDGIP
ncbi:jg9709 [Pararge aegeria aegeria]|uniref:Jg9709 protein n=1 Tax=Pararge aegeria aegeria TaxID=348720 RepID=A0A8S4SP18_9NEOP|nr:jg9709 [Pararge aegeria aegeria]